MGNPINKINYCIGDIIGECIYLGDAYSKNEKRYAHFKCKCGKGFISEIQKVKSLHTKSCGCYGISKIVAFNFKHGMSYSPEFHTWIGMIQRCTNKKNKRFQEWGGRGIHICERWLNSFEDFYADMGDRPSESHSLDRFPDNNGNYELGNCRWATPKEQSRNRKSNFIVEYKGEKKPLLVLAEKYGVSYNRVRQRIKKLGWSVEDAFEKSKCYV